MKTIRIIILSLLLSASVVLYAKSGVKAWSVPKEETQVLKCDRERNVDYLKQQIFNRYPGINKIVIKRVQSLPIVDKGKPGLACKLVLEAFYPEGKPIYFQPIFKIFNFESREELDKFMGKPQKGGKIAI